MKCEEAKLLVHALADGELDAVHAHEVEAHAKSCADCGRELTLVRDLRKEMGAAELRYTAPERLRRNLQRALPAGPARRTRRDLLRGFGAGVALSAVAASGAFVLLTRTVTQDRILGEVVSAHLRSLQPDHLTDVQSTDQHTVKPWFNGRIELAPPVVDLTAQGFTLIGGRLDSIDGKAVAAIVYRRRVHVINLFVASTSDAPRAKDMRTLQGFNILHWSDQGLSMWAVSDINADELQEFGRKLEAALHKGT